MNLYSHFKYVFLVIMIIMLMFKVILMILITLLKRYAQFREAISS